MANTEKLKYISQRLDFLSYKYGRGIASVVEYYYAATSDDVEDLSELVNKNYTPVIIDNKISDKWKTSITDAGFGPTNKYLWNVEKIEFDDGTYNYTNCAVISIYSKEIDKFVEFYLTSASESAPTLLPIKEKDTWQLNGWSEKVLIPDKDEPYLWNYEVTEYTDGTNDVETSHPVCIAVCGPSGEGRPGVHGAETEIISIYKRVSSTAAVTPPGDLDENTFPTEEKDNEWTSYENLRGTNDYPYVYVSKGYKRTNYTLDETTLEQKESITYSDWGTPELIRIYNSFGIDQADYAIFYRATNGVQSGLYFQDNGQLAIVADQLLIQRNYTDSEGNTKTKTLIQAIGTENVQIGGWTLDDNLFYNGTIGQSGSFWLSPKGINANVNIGGSGAYSINWCMAIGDKFGVTADGTLHTKDAVFSGDIIGGTITIGEYGFPNFQVDKDGNVTMKGDIYLTGNIIWGDNKPAGDTVNFKSVTDALTSDTDWKGLYYENGKLYIGGDYIKGGIMDGVMLKSGNYYLQGDNSGFQINQIEFNKNGEVLTTDSLLYVSSDGEKGYLYIGDAHIRYNTIGFTGGTRLTTDHFIIKNKEYTLGTSKESFSWQRFAWTIRLAEKLMSNTYTRNITGTIKGSSPSESSSLLLTTTGSNPITLEVESQKLKFSTNSTSLGELDFTTYCTEKGVAIAEIECGDQNIVSGDNTTFDNLFDFSPTILIKTSEGFYITKKISTSAQREGGGWTQSLNYDSITALSTDKFQIRAASGGYFIDLYNTTQNTVTYGPEIYNAINYVKISKGEDVEYIFQKSLYNKQNSQEYTWKEIAEGIVKFVGYQSSKYKFTINTTEYSEDWSNPYWSDCTAAKNAGWLVGTIDDGTGTKCVRKEYSTYFEVIYDGNTRVGGNEVIIPFKTYSTKKIDKQVVEADIRVFGSVGIYQGSTITNRGGEWLDGKASVTLTSQDDSLTVMALSNGVAILHGQTDSAYFQIYDTSDAVNYVAVGGYQLAPGESVEYVYSDFANSKTISMTIITNSYINDSPTTSKKITFNLQGSNASSTVGTWYNGDNSVSLSEDEKLYFKVMTDSLDIETEYGETISFTLMNPNTYDIQDVTLTGSEDGDAIFTNARIGATNNRKYSLTNSSYNFTINRKKPLPIEVVYTMYKHSGSTVDDDSMPSELHKKVVFKKIPSDGILKLQRSSHSDGGYVLQFLDGNNQNTTIEVEIYTLRKASNTSQIQTDYSSSDKTWVLNSTNVAANTLATFTDAKTDLKISAVSKTAGRNDFNSNSSSARTGFYLNDVHADMDTPPRLYFTVLAKE